MSAENGQTDTSTDKSAREGGAAAGTKNGAKKEIRKGPKIVGTIILIVLVIVGLCAGTVWGIDAIKYVSTDDAAIDGQQIKLSSKMLGRVSAITVIEGQHVESGDVLVTLDATDLRAQQTQAETSLAYARQNLALAKINLDKTRDDSVRTQNLFKNAAATRESYNHAKSAFDSAQAQLTLAQAQVDTSVAQLGVIKAQLLNTSLSTPISGTVDKITLVVGDVAQPGQTILSVNNLDDIWVVANLEETKIGRIQSGARVKMTVDAHGSRAFEGKVEMIRSGIVPPSFQIGEFTKTTQRIPVKIRFVNPSPGTLLLPGMSVEVKIRTTSPLPAFMDK